MVRMADKIVLVAMICLLGGTSAVAGSAPSQGARKKVPPKPPSPAAGKGKETVRLDEVKISGSPEYPGVLFFLPRTRFHLLPLRPEMEGMESFPRENRQKGSPAP